MLGPGYQRIYLAQLSWTLAILMFSLLMIRGSSGAAASCKLALTTWYREDCDGNTVQDRGCAAGVVGDNSCTKLGEFMVRVRCSDEIANVYSGQDCGSEAIGEIPDSHCINAKMQIPLSFKADFGGDCDGAVTLTKWTDLLTLFL